MKSVVVKRSVVVHGHKTNVTLNILSGGGSRR